MGGTVVNHRAKVELLMISVASDSFNMQHAFPESTRRRSFLCLQFTTSCFSAQFEKSNLQYWLPFCHVNYHNMIHILGCS